MNKATTDTRATNPNLAAKAAFSVREFCFQHDISRALFYQLVRRGSGPRIMKVAGRTLISADAAADWRVQMELATGDK